MSETLDTEPLASPDLSTPWVPLWPLAPARLGELAYAERTSDLTIPDVAPASAPIIVTSPAVQCDGVTPLEIEFFTPGLQNAGSSGSQIIVELLQDSVGIGRLGQVYSPAAIAIAIPFYASKRLTPAAGSHTYSVRAWAPGGAGSLYAGTDRIPAFIRISLAAPLLSAPPGAAVPVQYGTSLPTNPLDGQEAILVDSLTTPSYHWRFRYNLQEPARKWEYIGGSPKVFNYNQGGAVMDNPAFVLAGGWRWWTDSTGSVFTVPRSGDYHVRCKLYGGNGSGAAQNPHICVVKVTAAPTINVAVDWEAATTVGASSYFTLFTAGFIAGCDAGVHSIGMGWQTDTPSVLNMFGVWVEITPVRVS